MKLGTYVLRRLLLAVPVLLGVTLLTFGIAWQANEGHMERAYLTEKTTPEQRARIVEQYGFDEPPHIQYLNYLKRLATGDLGFSRVESDRPVLEVFREYLPATIEITLAAMVVAVVVGVAVGTITAVRKDSPVDHVTRFLALAGVSVPIFWLGLILKFALATSFPKEIFGTSPWPVKGVVLGVVLLVPVAIGLFVAEGLGLREIRGPRLAGHLAGAALLVGGFWLLDWDFLAILALAVLGTGYGAAVALKATRRRHLPARAWPLVAGGAFLLGFGIAAAGYGTTGVTTAFDLIPDLPLGGRFDNALIANAGEHPSLTDGPTRILVVDTLLARDWIAFQDVVRHLVLPGITLGYASLAVIARMMRASMLEVLSLDFVRTARAKGLPEAQVVGRHARRNALIPIATVVGLTFGGLLSGAVLTETIFQWPGLGRWSTRAIVAFDTTSIISFTLLVVLIYLVANFIVDILYSVIDPRVRLG